MAGRDPAGVEHGVERRARVARPARPAGWRGWRRGAPGRHGRRRTSGSRSRCAAAPSTRKRPVPPPGSAALTTSRSARAPCSTGSLVPLRVQGLAVRRRGDRGGSSWASARMLSPAARAPSSSARCSGVPTAATAPPASTTEARNGSGASTRPSSAATRPTSTGPAPMPPSSSAKGRPEDPHLGQLAPQGLVEAGVRGARPAALLEVAVRLGDQAAHRVTQRDLLVVEAEVHVARLLLQTQDGAGDDLALDLVRPAVDRGLAQVEVGRRGAPGPAGEVRVLAAPGAERGAGRRGRGRAR